MTEAAIQTAIVTHFRRHYEGHIIHVPNSGRRGMLEAIRFKAMGVKAGVPDLILFTPRGCYLVEVKTEKGVLSPRQSCFITDLQELGFDVAIVRSADEAARAFREWKLPRKEAHPVHTRVETGF